MKFTLTIDCDNAAFEDNGRHEEVARILRWVSDRLEGEVMTPQRDSFKLRDVNGNTVGNAEFYESAPLKR